MERCRNHSSFVFFCPGTSFVQTLQNLYLIFVSFADILRAETERKDVIEPMEYKFTGLDVDDLIYADMDSYVSER